MNNILEKEFYDTLIQKKGSVSIYLKNGVQLKGNVMEHDEKVVILKYSNSLQMIYKHTISTVMPWTDSKIQ
jgi:host factor-I protein